MPEDEIGIASPWWSDPASIERDPRLLSMERSRVRRAASEEDRFAAGDHVYTLRGPRRVGKTTLIMAEIRRLLGEGVPPRNILYCPLGEWGRPVDIYALVTEYLAAGGGRGRRFVFLDEVSDMGRWDSGVGKLLDRASLRGCTLVTAGRHAAEVAGSAARLRGRRREPERGALDRILRPMGFREYAAALDETVRSRLHGLSLDSGPARLEAARTVLGGELPDAVREMLPLVGVLNEHFRGYMLCGGMPEVASRFASAGSVPDGEYRALVRRAHEGMARSGLGREAASAILRAAARSVGSAASWKSLGSDAGIKSPRLVEEYAQKMSDLLLLHVIYGYGASEGAPRRSALKKLYFYDPIFLGAWSAAGRRGAFARSRAALGDDLRAGPLAEQAVACHVVRLAADLNARSGRPGAPDSVFHWKSNRGREVAFVVRTGADGRADRPGGAVSPVEAKWRGGRVEGDDLRGMLDFRRAAGMGGRGGAFLSMDSAEERSGIAVVPAAVFALLA